MSRLQEIDGTEIIDDLRLGHTWHEYMTLKHFIITTKAETFIEIGVHEGGLSYLLIPISKRYLGVEINCVVVRSKVVARYNKTIKAELLCNDYRSATVATKISTAGTKIIYCDGGNKPEELRYFKHFCNSGDIIMVHDYHDKISHVVGVPIVYPEIHPNDIIHMMRDNTFKEIFVPFPGTRIVAWRKI